jgi:hypothetical protein
MSDVQVSYGPAPAAAIETPSAAVIKDANRIVFVTDERGRKLGVKRAGGALANFRLCRLLGQDAANRALMTYALLITAVVSINGDPVPFPTTMLQLEALIDRVDSDGMRASERAQFDEFGVARSAEDEAQEAKN